MMRQYELVERVQAYNPDADEALLNRAYVYAMQKHGTQKRASGDPYFAHPLEVAAILTDLKLDDATIAVALLHDTIEDTDATRAEIDQLFGSEIGEIVEGLTKIERLNLVSREEAQAENLRKLLLAVSQDVRVLLVKLADRLHNMRTIHFVPEEKRRRIARETMEIYAPLAGRMGMQDLRTELETISFSALQPEQFEAITERLSEMQADNADVVDEIRRELTEKLSKANINATVFARLKSPFSIFRKIESKALAFEQLSDIIGFRIVVGTIDECYRALGVVHATWKMVPGRFKDYISIPKYNDYRSIHTTIVGPGRHRAELQIRTAEMHGIAENGIAAHALYKDGILSKPNALESESQAYAWLRKTIEHLTAGNDPSDFVEFTKLELFHDQVFCFTPRGRLIALPRGATPVDFAYAVHTDIGDTCNAAKINGVLSPLQTPLRNGDEVHILRDHNLVMRSGWERMAVTGKARAAIRRNLRQAEQDRLALTGANLLSGVLQENDLEETDETAYVLAVELGFQKVSELKEALAKGVISVEQAHEAATKQGGKRPISRRERKIDLPLPMQQEGWFSLRQGHWFQFRIPGGQNLVPEMSSVLEKLGFETEVTVSPEGVLPGDRLVAILDEQGLITVYPIHSEALSEFHEGSVAWIDAIWDSNMPTEEAFTAAVSMMSTNRPGMLAQVSSTMARAEVNITNLALRRLSLDFHHLVFQVEVRDVLQVEELLTILRNQEGLTEIRRATFSESQALDKIEHSAL